MCEGTSSPFVIYLFLHLLHLPGMALGAGTGSDHLCSEPSTERSLATHLPVTDNPITSMPPLCALQLRALVRAWTQSLR